MSEKEIVKPKRKKKSSESETAAAPVVKEIKKSKKAAAKDELKGSETDLIGKPGSAKKTKTTGKPLLISSEEITTNINDTVAPNAAPIVEIPAEAVRTVENAETENVTNDSVVEAKPRKRVAKSKRNPITASSDSVVKKAVLETKDGKPESLVIEDSKPTIESQNIETKSETINDVGENLTSEKEESPIFKELAEPKLPTLPRENRARLQMQSPNRIFLYWSTKHDPFETLQRAFPHRAQNYTLTAKLLNLNNNTEEVFPVGNPSGSWWFNVNSNTAYRAELGLFAPGRPFIRLMYSNTVETPRSAPSPNTDWSTDFTVSATQFAEVLDASGYEQDAFEVALAGDDKDFAEAATRETFFQITGEESPQFGDVDELRSALFALASGDSLESLRERISAGLFEALQTIARENVQQLSAENVMSALRENFDFESDREEFLTPVFGASSINFPKRFRSSKFSPISSLRSVTSR